jgi:hypothetical protein
MKKKKMMMMMILMTKEIIKYSRRIEFLTGISVGMDVSLSGSNLKFKMNPLMVDYQFLFQNYVLTVCSDVNSDEDISEELTCDQQKVLEFLSKADALELQQMHLCSMKKAKLIIDCRPFGGWSGMVEKLRNKESLGGEVLNHVLDLLRTRKDVAAIISACRDLACQMAAAVTAGLPNVQTQPAMMCERYGSTSFTKPLLAREQLFENFNQITRHEGILGNQCNSNSSYVQVYRFFATPRTNGSRGPSMR